MSSPLSFFRRNQKVMLAVFGVLIMLTFVVGDYLLQYGAPSGGGSVANEVVVTWKHGKIDEGELWAIRDAHNLTVRFLDLLVQKTIEAKGQPKGLGVVVMNGRVFDPGIPRSYAEEDLVQTVILARKAQDLGVRITDAALDEFLDTLSDDVVPRSEFGPLLQEATQGRLDRAQLFDQLRIELAAQHMRMMAGSGLFAMSPSLAWDGFNRMNRRVKAELLPVPVADFESQVTAQPTEAQIVALYEEGRDRYPSPDSPEAGFKRRRKIAFEYLKADFEKFLQEEMAAVTPEQVEEYYENNKSDFKVPDQAADEAPKPADAVPGDRPPTETPATEPEKESQPAAESEPVQPAKSPDQPVTGEAEEMPAEKPAAKDPSAAKEEELKLEAPGTNPKPAPEGEAKQSRRDVPRRAPTFFVSYPGDEAVPPESDAAPAPATKSQPAAAKEKEPAPTTKTEVSDKPDKPAPEQESVQEPAAKDEPAEEPAAAMPQDGAGEAGDPPAQYKPLSEVEAEIRRNLARAPAQDKVTASLKAARTELDKYFRLHASWRAQAKSKVPTPEPPRPDLKQLAQQHGLIVGDTPPVDELEIADYELGKAFRFSFAGNQFRRESFAEIAFTDRQPLFKADQIRSFEIDVEFLYWKTAEQEAFVPKLAEVRDEVIKAWKRGEAFQMARAEAERMAKALPGDKPLRESVTEAQSSRVLEPPEFTWLTRGSLPMGSGAPMLNAVEGVDFPSHDFMRAVFALEPGEIGVAANGPQTVVYVVRIASESPDEETRRQLFADGGLTNEMNFLARVELQTYFSQWYRDLEQEMDLHWKRPPQGMQMVE